MLNRIDLRGRDLDPAGLRDLLPRAALDVTAAVQQVRLIVDAVRERGADAVREATRRLDGVEVAEPRVGAGPLAEALAGLDPQVRAAMTEAVERVRRAHAAQLPAEVTTELAPGARVTQTWRPVERVGLYVPGGGNTLPSSVIMNVVPATVAGVGSIALASPPQRLTGLPDPTILAACALLGVDEVYAVGGAQAVAMFAYGVPGGCSPVDLVTGPGSVYTNAAKRLVRGVVGVDAEAGPSEVAILADDTAEPAHLAADLISQAEHGELSASVLVTPSLPLLDAVDAELVERVATTKHQHRVTAALTGQQSGSVLVDDLPAGLRVVDGYAAEHLEIQTRDARALARRVRHAGAVFVGPHSPVSLGDYCAGSNHVLPTGGCARHGGGLSVQTFLRGVQVVEYDRPALAEVAGHVVGFAEAEDLPAHGAAVTARFAQ
ncbi:MAG: histidinol dehydrogenase [Micromonosporaceae bacterium]|nr:histidinol dehydrogenase [Micromonosporaceae bacterium]